MAPWLLVVLTGFAGSFHCAAMCGPFVGYYSLGGGRRGLRHAAYHAGRLTAYLALGAVAGSLGRGVFFGATVLGLQRAAMTAMGLAMIAVALAAYLPHKLPGSSLRARLGRLLRDLLGRVGGTERAALTGLLTTLLPCGFLYAYAFAAMATGSPLAGMATMAAFWLGTAPTLLGIGLTAGLLNGRAPARLKRLTPLLLMTLGLLAVMGKWHALPLGPAAGTCLTP